MDVPGTRLTPRPMSADGVVGDYLDALRRFRDQAASTGPDEWGLPTDCPGWDVHDVVAHVVSFEAMLDGQPTPEPPTGSTADDEGLGEIARLNAAWVASLRSRPGPDLVDDLDRLVARRTVELTDVSPEALDEVGWSPVGDVPRSRFLQIRTFDVWFHEQDVRAAVGRPGGLTGPAAERALSEVHSALGFVVGRKGRAPDGSSIRFALEVPDDGASSARVTVDVAVDGRARVVDGLPGDPTTTIATDLATFTRLLGGRRDPAAAIDAGSVTFRGDRRLGEQVVRNLAYVI